MFGRSLSAVFRRGSKVVRSCQSTQCMQATSCSQPWEGECFWSSRDDNNKRDWPRDFRTVLISTRGLSTYAEGLQSPLSVQEAQDILKRVDAAHLGELIKRESQTRWNMKYDDLIKLCTESGTSPNPEEAKTVCNALDKAGVVLRVKDLVYLRPLEVAEILYQALPDTDKEILAKLNQLKTEAEPLLQQKAKIDNHAHRVSKGVLWTGLAIFTAQVVLYARLTFWELSWDVMEPITYFTSATFAILAYIYCLWYNEEFGYQKAKSRIHSSIQNKKYAEKGLNKVKLDYLLERINHLEQTLSPRHFAKEAKEREDDDEGQDSSAPAAAKAGLKTVPAT